MIAFLSVSVMRGKAKPAVLLLTSSTADGSAGEPFVLMDVPLGINNYNDYEKYVIQLLEQIQGFKNIYIYNDLFLANILTNIANYKNSK